MTVLLHLGCILVGVPYSVPDLYLTKGGGAPYGPGHVAGADNLRDIDENEANICGAFGRRLAEITIKLSIRRALWHIQQRIILNLLV
ncbi:MAG: hypothetical protein ACK4TF_01490 [Thermodesulfovibrionales bacterium]